MILTLFNLKYDKYYLKTLKALGLILSFDNKILIIPRFPDLTAK